MAADQTIAARLSCGAVKLMNCDERYQRVVADTSSDLSLLRSHVIGEKLPPARIVEISVRFQSADHGIRSRARP